jgi:hypothetical protein
MKKRTVEIRDGMTVVYEDGVLDSETPQGDGVARFFHENGAVRAEVPKVAGETQGLCRGWHDNGQLSEEHTILDRRIIGVARTWNRDGTLSHEMEYLTPHAIYAKSHNSGKVRRLFLWEGKPISRTRWMKKVEAAGISRSELGKRFGAWVSSDRSGAA